MSSCPLTHTGTTSNVQEPAGTLAKPVEPVTHTLKSEAGSNSACPRVIAKTHKSLEFHNIISWPFSLSGVFRYHWLTAACPHMSFTFSYR